MIDRYKPIDRDAILATYDVLKVIEGDLKRSADKRAGAWFFFCCPFHGEGKERTASMSVTPANGRWYCFACGAGGNVIDWTIKYHGLQARDLPGAARLLGELPEVVASEPVDYKRPAVQCDRPSAVWCDRAAQYIGYTKTELWEDSGAAALEYLHFRGLLDDTIRAFHLGYNPQDLYDGPAKWGISGSKKLYLSMGITMPCMIDNEPWYIQTRRPHTIDEGKGVDMLSVHLGTLPRFLPDRKYWSVKGSSLNAVYGLDQMSGIRSPYLLIDEGEFNAQIAWQEARDLIDVWSVGSSSTRPGALWQWRDHILLCNSVLLRMDRDASDKARAFAGDLSDRCRVVQTPSGQDTNDFYVSGGSVRDWIAFEIARIEARASNGPDND